MPNKLQIDFIIVQNNLVSSPTASDMYAYSLGGLWIVIF